MNLSYENSELLASRLKGKNLLDSGTKESFYYKTSHELMVSFTESSVETGKFVYCHNVYGLLIYMDLPKYDPSDLKFFIDSFKRSLKCLLQHNSNEYASVPIRHSVQIK